VPAPVRAESADAEAAAHPWLAARLARPRARSWYDKPAGLDEGEVRKARAVYLGLITEVDHHIGRIVSELEVRGEFERTLILVTSDHGELLGDHWLLGKDCFFREAFHVPLIVVDPGANAVRCRIVEAFTENVDPMPTVLECIGLEPPLQCDGRSLVHWLEGGTPAGWREAAHYEYDFRDVETRAFETALGLASDRCAIAVRQSDDYAYVHFNGMAPFCYDLRRDPHQLRNIAGDRARAPEVLEQAQGMLSWRMDMAERRLTGCKLTPAGPLGPF
jgi:arylsulfatase A-like enzyme